MQKATRVYFLALIIFSLSSGARADDTELVHFAAHFGASYAINMTGYGFLEKTVGVSRAPAFVLAALSTLAIGYSYKYIEMKNGGGSENVPKAMIENSLGVAAAGLTVVSFDF